MGAQRGQANPHNWLDMQLVNILPGADRRCLEAMAWAADRCSIPKEPQLSIPEPGVAVEASKSDSLPEPPASKDCLTFNLFVHVEEALVYDYRLTDREFIPSPVSWAEHTAPAWARAIKEESTSIGEEVVAAPSSASSQARRRRSAQLRQFALAVASMQADR